MMVWKALKKDIHRNKSGIENGDWIMSSGPWLRECAP